MSATTFTGQPQNVSIVADGYDVGVANPLPIAGTFSATVTVDTSLMAKEVTLASIDAKLASLGQKAMAGSTPVVIASDQAAIPITGTISATNPSVSATGSAVPASGTMIAGSDGTNLRAVKVSAAGLVSVDASGATVPVSATALPLPTGAATAANQATGNASLASLDGKVTAVNTGAVVVSSSALPSGAATSAKQDSQTTLLAGGLPAALGAGGGLKVDGSGTALPVSGTVTANLGTLNGVSTAANQVTSIASLASIDGKITAVNTGAVVVSGSALPTGASTSANQTTANASLASLDGKFGSLGQKAMAGSTPVVLASDQSLPLPANALQETGGNIATLVGRTPALGQALAAASSPVVLPLTQDVVASVAGATNSSIPGKGLVIGGSDYAGNLQFLKIDSSGRPFIQGAGASGSALAGNPILMAGSDGTNARSILTTTAGVQKIEQTYGIVPSSVWSTNAFTTFPTTGILIKSGAGVVRYLQVINTTGGVTNLQLFDRTTTPSGGAVPLIAQQIGSAAAGVTSLIEGGFPFATGLFIVLSSTLATYTAIVSTSVSGVVAYA